MILLDWDCRQSFHIFDYLSKQNVPRDWFEVIWIEYYDRTAPEIARRVQDAGARGGAPPVDRWIVMNIPRTAYYHKHLMYNVGILASRSELIMIGDSDAMVKPSFIETLVDAFAEDSQIVLHLDEVRNQSHRYYPFNHPTFDEVSGEGCLNWHDGKTTGVRETFDPIHVRNYGACLCARRDDVIAIGGADEHVDYLGHICGPYDLTWRLVNLGRREVWHESEFLYHVWHPGSDGDDNYLGPHDGRNVSTVALETRRTGRVMPLVESPIIRQLREGQEAPSAPLEGLIDLAIGDRPLTEWVIDDAKRAMSAGRAAWSQRRYADAIAIWEPLRDRMEPSARFLTDLGSAYYFAGRQEDARRALEDALRLDATNPDAHRVLGWALALQTLYAAAVPEYTSAIALADPMDRSPIQEAHRGRAWSEFHLGQFDEAAADFARALDLTAPSDVGARQDIERGLGWVHLRLGSAPQASNHFVLALAALGERKGPEYDDAAKGLKKARELSGQAMPVAARRRAVASPANVDATLPAPGPGASALAEARIRVRTALRCELGDTYAAAGRHRDALRVFEEVLSLDRHNLRAVCGAGWAQLRLGCLDQANRAFKRVIGTPTAEQAQLRAAFHGRGRIAYRQGHLRDAVKAFTRALQAADPARDGAAIREIRNALKRAYYLTGEKNVTLGTLARTSGSSRLQLAMQLHGRAAKNRVTRLLLAFRREQVH